jgi:hypothetical protein
MECVGCINSSSTFPICGTEHSLAHLPFVFRLYEDLDSGMLLAKLRRMRSGCALWSIAKVVSSKQCDENPRIVIPCAEIRAY